MQLEFRLLSVNPAHACAMLMSNFGRAWKFFEAKDENEALKTIARAGWVPFATLPAEDGSKRMLVARPIQ